MPEQEKQERVQGWADVTITPDMPITVLINFMNVLNQRLVALEDVTQVPSGSKMISLTELYAIQAKAQAEAMAAQRQEHEDHAEAAEDVEVNPDESQGA